MNTKQKQQIIKHVADGFSVPRFPSRTSVSELARCAHQGQRLHVPVFCAKVDIYGPVQACVCIIANCDATATPQCNGGVTVNPLCGEMTIPERDGAGAGDGDSDGDGS